MISFSAIETPTNNNTDKPDDINTVAYRRGARKLNVLSIISAPSPTFAPIHSPTIAPITQVVAAIFRAENKKGREDGRRIFQNTSDFEADRILASSNAWVETDCNPRTMFTRVGKKQIRAAITTLAVMPGPKINTKIGAMARIGMVLMKTAIGKKARSTERLWTKATAINIAVRLPMKNPARLSMKVGQKFSIKRGNSVLKTITMSEGAGAM